MYSVLTQRCPDRTSRMAVGRGRAAGATVHNQTGDTMQAHDPGDVMSTPNADGSSAAPESCFLGHPRMLWVMLATTVGVNFGFYGVRAFLAPYVADTFFAGLPLSQALTDANLMFAGFGALIYGAAIVGGWVADNVLGEVQALRLSLWLQIPGMVLAAVPNREAFLLALALGNHIGGRVAAASGMRQRLCVAAGAMLAAETVRSRATAGIRICFPFLM